MHKVTIRYAVDFKETWNLSEEEVINLRTGICSMQFQKRLLEEHESLKFHYIILRNLYVKCDTNEVVFIFEPDWSSKYVFDISIIDPNNRFLENYLYDNIIKEIIEIGKFCNKWV